MHREEHEVYRAYGILAKMPHFLIISVDHLYFTKNLPFKPFIYNLERNI